MSSRLPRLNLTTAYAMVGHGQGRRVEPGTITADMSWLGDPPTAEQSARYEQRRAPRHFAALFTERSVLEARAQDVARTYTESPTHRARVAAELAELHARLAVRCQCELCKGAA